jgi:ABC-type sugar transport system permease subunit
MIGGGMERRETLWRIIFLSPVLLVFLLFVMWPLLDSFRYSVTDWNGFSPDYKFVGLSNFAKIGSDPSFRGAILNTTLWVIAALVLPTLLGLGLALLLNSGIRGSSVFKTVFYLPICLSAVVVGQSWMWIYHPDWGLLNSGIELLSGTKFNFAWLANPSTALWSVIFAWAWQQTGLAMVIFLAGLTSVPQDMLEAARVDNVSRWQQTRHIVLPMLRPATVVVVALSIISALKGFDILYIMTGGGPFKSSSTLAFFMYEESFKKYRMGYGSAISVVLFFITVTIILVYFRQLKKLGEIYD